MKKIYSLLVLLVPALALQAQQAASSIDSVKARELQEVIVTGQHKPQSVKNSVYQVKVINRERIQKQAATKLQDVLASELNIRFSQDLATGGSDISMLGLSGQNVKILIDGIPMVGRQGTSNEIDINQIDINSIERIEIVEGPLSVVYGADALAGVINIITKKPQGQKLSVTARLQEETIGKEYGWQQGIHNQYAGLSYNYKNWQFAGSIGHNLFNGWRGDTTGRELRWHKKDQLIANGLIGYRNNRFNIYYRFDGLDEIITNPANAAGSQPATDQDYLTKRIMQQLQSAYTINGNLSASAQVAYTHFSRQLYSTLFYPNGDVRVSTAPGAHSTNAFDGIAARASMVYRPSAFFSLQPGIDINAERATGERISKENQQISDYAFFVTAEIALLKKLNIRPGIRMIRNSVYDAPPIIPSLNAKWGLTKNLDLRMAYAKGFRAPSIRELYFDFRDASHDILGNTNLKAEQSDSYTGSLNWKALHRSNFSLSATLTGFYNDVDNMITYVQSPTDPRVTTYDNIERYKSRGATLGAELTYKALRYTAGFSYIDYYNQFSAADKSLPGYTHSVELNSTASYTWRKTGLDFNLFYKYTGKRPYYTQTTLNGQPAIVQAQVDGYHWIDITVQKKIYRWIVLNAGVRNLADISFVNSSANLGGTHSSAGARPIGYGRSYFMGIVFNWEKSPAVK